MANAWLDIDIISLLQLNKTLNPLEIDELVDEINKEVWYRVLNEELPKKITDGEFQKLLKKFPPESNFDDIVSHIQKNYPKVGIELILYAVITQVKKEYVIQYIIEIEEEQGREVYREKNLDTFQNNIFKTIQQLYTDLDKPKVNFIAIKKKIDNILSLNDLLTV